MSLRDRLSRVSVTLLPEDQAAVQSRKQIDELKRGLHYRLIEEHGNEFGKRGRDSATLREELGRVIRRMVDEQHMPLSASDRAEIVDDIIDNIVGYGPIEVLLRDPDVTEIMVNNPDSIFIERDGKIHQTDRHFIDEQHLLRIIDKIVSQVGRRIDESVPMVDARLPDGSRVNAIIHPLAINGPMLTIRKFSSRPFGVDDLVRMNMMTDEVAEFLARCVQGRLNALISGGTGSGKTTLLNVLSSFVPNDERIVTIEDAAELKLAQEHVLRLEARPSNIEGKGEITIRDLVRNSLRMRPDRIIVGEVRGGEALDMLQAMNTGHDGSLSTIHANSPRDAMSRLETMVLMAGFDLPVRAIREQVTSALSLLVHTARLSDGTRRVVQVTEVQGMEGDVIVLEDIFTFDFGAGLDANGRFRGKLRATGIRPRLAQRLEDHGIEFDPVLFAAGA